MTKYELLGRMRTIDAGIGALLQESGFYRDGAMCQDDFLPFDPDDLFWQEELEKQGGLLASFHDSLARLNAPVRGEYRLRKWRNGRYGYRRGNGSIVELSCGQPVEALVAVAGRGERWVSSRIGHDGKDYCLVGYPGKLHGLSVRERG